MELDALATVTRPLLLGLQLSRGLGGSGTPDVGRDLSVLALDEAASLFGARWLSPAAFSRPRLTIAATVDSVAGELTVSLGSGLRGDGGVGNEDSRSSLRDSESESVGVEKTKCWSEREGEGGSEKSPSDISRLGSDEKSPLCSWSSVGLTSDLESFSSSCFSETQDKRVIACIEYLQTGCQVHHKVQAN